MRREASFPRSLRVALLAAGVASAFPAAAQDAPGDPRAGRRLAGGNCAACHGNDGIAVLPEAPSLAGQSAPYVAAQLRQYRSGERKNEQMTLVAAELTDPQIADLAAWYASIQVEATILGR